MEQTCTSLTFTCPACKETFEFDDVGEYELVFCPACGKDLMTIRKDKRLILQRFDLGFNVPKASSLGA